MLTSSELPAKDAVAYHRELAVGWEQRYTKPAFKARLQAVGECLAGHNLHSQDWLDAGCGSGALARYLVVAGAHLLGVEASEDMIAMAPVVAFQDVEGMDEQTQPLRFWHVALMPPLPPPG